MIRILGHCELINLWQEGEKLQQTYREKGKSSKEIFKVRVFSNVHKVFLLGKAEAITAVNSKAGFFHVKMLSCV